jgi:hypothetical protein
MDIILELCGAQLRKEEEESSLRQLTAAEYEELTGFAPHIVEQEASYCGADFYDLSAAACMVHMHLTWQQLRIVWRLGCGFAGSERDLRRKAMAALWKCASHPKKSVERNWRYKTRDSVSNFLRVTAIADGAPLYCKGSNAFYHGKKKRKYHSILVYIAVDGTLLDYQGPFIGRRNDARASKYKCPSLFKKHFKWEIIAGDGAFESCAHHGVPFDRPALHDPRTGSNKSKRRYNKLFSRMRSRVEHTFARINRHALMYARAAFRPKTAALLFRLLWNLEVATQLEQWKPNDRCEYNETEVDGEWCNCHLDGNWQAGSPAGSRPRDDLNQWREDARHAMNKRKNRKEFNNMIREFRVEQHASKSKKLEKKLWQAVASENDLLMGSNGSDDNDQVNYDDIMYSVNA